MNPLSPEKSPSLTTIETQKLVVSQPAKLQELNKLLDSFDKLTLRVGETTGEDRSGDLGSSGMTATGQQKTQRISPRDAAIANLPAQPVMKEKLTKHIEHEVKELEKLASGVGRRSAHPGMAFRLNEIYARIRRLNALLSELWELSVDVLRRLFIRVFVDKQPVM